MKKNSNLFFIIFIVLPIDAMQDGSSYFIQRTNAKIEQQEKAKNKEQEQLLINYQKQQKFEQFCKFVNELHGNLFPKLKKKDYKQALRGASTFRDIFHRAYHQQDVGYDNLIFAFKQADNVLQDEKKEEYLENARYCFCLTTSICWINCISCIYLWKKYIREEDVQFVDVPRTMINDFVYRKKGEKRTKHDMV